MNIPAYTISPKAIALLAQIAEKVGELKGSGADFLAAHKFMTEGAVKEAGQFRSQDVGVFAGNRLVHAGASYQFVPKLIADL